MADHKLRLRIVSAFLLTVSFVLTLVFVITATGNISESYGLTKITYNTADRDSDVYTFTLGLLNVAYCSNNLGVCVNLAVDNEVITKIFDIVHQYDVATCPTDAGKWMIAGQSLILAFLLYPILSIIFNFNLRFKRIACLVPLVIAVGLAVSCVAVWSVMCIDDFNWDPCSESSRQCASMKGEMSGAFGLEVATLALLIGGAICAVLYQIWPGDKSAADVPNPVQMASPSASALSISTDAPTSPSGSTVAYTNGFGY